VASELGQAAEKKTLLDVLDVRIIDCLKNDVRMSNRKVAAALHISEGTIRTRLKRMLDEKQIRLTATSDLEQLNFPKVAYIGVDAQGNKTTAICQALAALPEINFVCTTLGRHEIFCCAVLPGFEPITETLQKKITEIPGVKNTESSHCIKHIKNQIELGLIL
jgi:Lrp/AsnC family transcriptional regulator, regulator for asnA, asnC and gidA